MTECWYRVIVGDPMLEADPFTRVRDRFRDRYPQAPAARLVTRLESEDSLHCVAVAYLSPAAAALALDLGAQAVPRPDWLDPIAP